MLDLTKPIRRKSDRAPVMVSEVVSYFVEPMDDPQTYKLSRTELEAIYENIPEPRKPQRWIIGEGSRCAMPWDKEWMPSIPYVHVIEWPQDAPIPDWPERHP